MSELSTGNLVESLGRADISGNYYHGNYWRSSDIKWLERERVLSFVLDIASGFPAETNIRMLSMPGLSWVFETMLLLAAIKTQLVCIERSKSIYQRAKKLIPTHLANSWIGELKERMVPYGNGTILYSRVHARNNDRRPHGFTNRSHRLLLMDLATYTSIFLTNYGATLQDRQSFSTRFYSRNAVWLDFVNQLGCAGTDQAISNLHWCLEPPDRQSYPKPICITVMNARDGLRGDDVRVAKMLALNTNLTYRDHWTFIGKGKVSMLTACFTCCE